MRPNPRIEPPRSYIRPDGGYGWFIVFATFLCYVCVAGTTKANGLFFVYFLETFGASNSATSAITFVQKISETVTALMWSILAERYGSRPVVFAGAITATIGAVLSAFAPNIFVITLTYGVICGMSFSMINYPAVQMLPRYFEKHLVVATALIYCGTPVGSLTVPYLLTLAVSSYGLSGAFFIVAGILFHVFVAAALLRPYTVAAEKRDNLDLEAFCDPDIIMEENESGDTFVKGVPNNCPCRSVSQCFHKASSCSCNLNEHNTNHEELEERNGDDVIVSHNDSIDEATITANPSLKPAALATISAIASPASMKRRKTVTLQSTNSEVAQNDHRGSDRTHRNNSVAENLRLRRLRSQLSVGSVTSVAAVENLAVSFAIMDNMSMASRQHVTAIGRQLSIVPFNHMNSQFGSRSALRGFERMQSKLAEPERLASRATSINGLPSNLPILLQPTPPSSVEDSESSEPIDENDGDMIPPCPPSIFRALVEKYRSIVKDRLFLLLAFSNFLHSFGMSLWVIFQQAYIVDVGYNDSFKQIFLISASSFAELASRLSLGFIIGRNWMKVYRWNQIACCLMALAIFTYPFITSFPFLVLYNCFVASVFSINVVTSMPNLKEFLGIDMAALGQGLMVIPMGLGIVSVQIGGVIRDVTGSFIPAFYMAGTALLISAINFQIIGFLSHHQHLPFWACFFCSEKDVADENHIGAIVTETLLSNNTQDVTFTSPNGHLTSNSKNVDSNLLQVPGAPRTFTDEVIEMLHRDQSLQQVNLKQMKSSD